MIAARAAPRRAEGFVDYVEVFLGTVLVGAIAVPLNARYRAHELAYVVENADLAALVTSDIVEEHIDYVALLHDSLPGLADAGTRRVAIYGEEEER